MMAKINKKHVGSTLDDLLAEDGTLAEVEAVACKRVLAWELSKEMQRQRISKSEMARRMKTSRPALDRLLDPSNDSVTLRTLGKAASVIGKHLHMELR
jgi:hypothetical protein